MSDDYQYPNEPCPECDCESFIPIWYGLGGIEDYKGARCDSCKTYFRRSENGSTEVVPLSDAEVIR